MGQKPHREVGLFLRFRCSAPDGRHEERRPDSEGFCSPHARDEIADSAALRLGQSLISVGVTRPVLALASNVRSSWKTRLYQAFSRVLPPKTPAPPGPLPRYRREQVPALKASYAGRHLRISVRSACWRNLG